MSCVPSKGRYFFKIFATFLLSGAIVLGGGLLAAYNTERFGFAGQNPVVGADSEKIYVLGAEISYDDLKTFGRRFVYATSENTYVCLV